MSTLPDLPAAVRVRAPGRLHLGFMDPAGTLGRRFGSLGLVVDGLHTTVELRRLGHDEGRDKFSAADAPAAAELPRARAHLDALRRATGQTAPLHLHIAQALPAHAGFGSGTQLALAVGRAFSAVFGLALPTAKIARLTGRGQRSGVGIAGFDQGGLLLDGGPRADGEAAPLISRIVLPSAWRVLLVIDARLRGLNGDAEKAALATLAPLPREGAAEICHEVLMRVLPGAAGAEFAPFAAGLTRVQRLLGQHFALAQGGQVFVSAAVGRLIDWVGAHTPAGVGQSSWGPTGFAVLPSADAANAIIVAAHTAGIVDAALVLHTVRARDHGAVVELLPLFTPLTPQSA
jgi:beta-ribofuranosylaminobenzene 5'-phosphate synthase